MITLTIDDVVHEANGGERLIDLINRVGLQVAQVCYHPQLGPIQTCDTCMVERKPFRLTGRILIRGCCGMAAQQLENRAAFPAAIAFLFAPAML
jgi:predicted molibdopterin-dependent oxidoreductase YjgC